jgi:hypothetical protein
MPSERYKDGYISGFIELENGSGVSDDAAFLYIGLTYGIEAAYGFLLMDAIDTWDKCTPVIRTKGQDELIGQKVKDRYEALYGNGSFPITEKDVAAMIYVAAIDKRDKKYFPSCSQRRFVQIDDKTGLHPIESHVAWIRSLKEEGFVPPEIKLAFKQVPSGKFYGKFKRKYKTLADERMIENPYDLPPYDGVHQSKK